MKGSAQQWDVSHHHSCKIENDQQQKKRTAKKGKTKVGLLTVEGSTKHYNRKEKKKMTVRKKRQMRKE